MSQHKGNPENKWCCHQTEPTHLNRKNFLNFKHSQHFLLLKLFSSHNVYPGWTSICVLSYTPLSSHGCYLSFNQFGCLAHTFTTWLRQYHEASVLLTSACCLSPYLAHPWKTKAERRCQFLQSGKHIPPLLGDSCLPCFSEQASSGRTHHHFEQLSVLGDQLFLTSKYLSPAN